MKKYLLQVSSGVNHAYEIEAESEEQAINIFYSYDNDQLVALDIDGQSSWDSPWDVEEIIE
jgi:hypothetical protein